MDDSTAAGKPVHLEDADDLDTFLEEHEIALVELYSSGCPKCQAMEPVLGNVARSTAVPIGLVNPADDVQLLERFDVQSVPTLILFRDGDPIARLSEGFVGGDELVAFLEDEAPEAVADGA